ncbi:hypothetical protein [Streptococcus equinus]|uniref:hypothetical protein n=1 Tax=Streptococcus equinus TaxID=1335 RepID=UPI001F434913|nr:hypothetical protein [Streptococcus equinus]
MIEKITSSIELEELLQDKKDICLITSSNQCSISSLKLSKSVVDAKNHSLALYQADVFQVPKLLSLYHLKPTETTILFFENGKLVSKQEL